MQKKRDFIGLRKFIQNIKQKIDMYFLKIYKNLEIKIM